MIASSCSVCRSTRGVMRNPTHHSPTPSPVRPCSTRAAPLGRRKAWCVPTPAPRSRSGSSGRRCGEASSACRSRAPCSSPRRSTTRSARACSVPLCRRHTVVLRDRFDAVDFLRTVDEMGVTSVPLVPTLIIRLAKLSDDEWAADDVSSLQWITHTAVPCPAWAKQTLIDRVGADRRRVLRQFRGHGSGGVHERGVDGAPGNGRPAEPQPGGVGGERRRRRSAAG